MVDSHTVAHALSGHYRGKPDHVMKPIAETDGLIGICCIPRFLGGSGDIAAFLDHLDYVAKLVGADHVAIGTDVSYSPKRQEHLCESKGMLRRPKRREPVRSLWPEPGCAPPENLSARARASLSWVNWPLFTVGLVMRGHSDENIRKILGGNVLRVARANWDRRKP